MQKHHATSDGVSLVYAKKHTGIRSLSYADAVEEALCFGWIDNRINSIDDQFFMQAFTPRRPKSGWSGLNKQRVAKLLAAGLMMPAGQKMIDLAKETGTWALHDSVESLVLPKDFLTAIGKSAKARANLEASSATTRKMCLYRLNSAKRPETRARYIKQLVDALKTGKNPFRMQTRKQV